MFKNLTLRAVLAVGIGLVVSGSVVARSLPREDNGPRGPVVGATAAPAYCAALHNIGKIALTVTNYGNFGTSDGSFIQGSTSDCFTGEALVGVEYPKGSNTQYCFAASFWIGAVKGEDTLVSVGADGWLAQREMQPYDVSQEGSELKTRSIIDPDSEEYELAVSEQDIIAVYTDTFTTGVGGLGQDEIDGRNHRPIGFEVAQRSYAWSYSYAEDFVLFDYTIKNNSNERLDNVYMGLYVDADVGESGAAQASVDDICGFLNDIPSPPNYSGSCTYFRDTVYIAWIADGDGKLNEQTPVPHVTGSRIIRTPAETLNVSFNWWVSNGSPQLDFGPRHRDKARDLGTGGKGTPAGDRNKYFFLRNTEHDYDQIFTKDIAISDSLWEYPTQAVAQDISNGFDTRYLLSFGPFTLQPGDDGPLSFAYVAGENFHTVTNNWDVNLGNAYLPYAYMDNVSFEDIGLNAMWASWVYDNPGIDTDGNGSRGSFRVCYDSCLYDTIVAGPPAVVDTNCFGPDTLYYTGDGAPDFRGASPPPAPLKWVYPSEGKLRVRWNGLNSETTKDVFSRVADFEGYRVYLARDERAASFTSYASFDVEDYNKFVYTTQMPGGGAGYVLKDNPFTREQLIALYSAGNPNWAPETFTINNPYRKPGFLADSIFYFQPQDFNRSNLGVSTPITKIYPDAPYPPVLVADSIPEASRDTFLTEDGYFKYWEYEVEIENLLPTVPYYVNVTAFDFGSPQSGLGSLETSVTVNYEVAFPQASSEKVAAEDLPVYIYPNPYRFDGDYRVDGFEGRDKATRGKAPDRQRVVNFANLPPQCTIKIFTLDGDLVREITHDVDPTDPTATHGEWDLITRNTQLIVSGIYYWTVEEPSGKIQMGKMVIIM